jgi:hypothetical protein
MIPGIFERPMGTAIFKLFKLVSAKLSKHAVMSLCMAARGEPLAWLQAKCPNANVLTWFSPNADVTDKVACKRFNIAPPVSMLCNLATFMQLSAGQLLKLAGSHCPWHYWSRASSIAAGAVRDRL